MDVRKYFVKNYNNIVFRLKVVCVEDSSDYTTSVVTVNLASCTKMAAPSQLRCRR